jgi:hypothetical protein
MREDDEYGFWDADRDWLDDRPHRAVSTTQVRRRVVALCAALLLAVTVALIVRSTSGDDRISTSVGVDAGNPAPVALAPLVPRAPAAVVTAPVTLAAAPASTTAPRADPATTAADTESTASRSQANLLTESATGARPVELATAVVETKRRCAISYKVRSGDYWIAIARASSVKLAALLTVNGAVVTTPLYPGRSICRPANATAPTGTTVKATPTTTTVKATAATTKPTATTAKPTASTTKPTTPPTTAAPSTTAPPPQNIYSRAQVEQIIRNVWPDELEDEAVRIATRESNLIPTVRNSCCYGLFQIYFAANKSSLNSWGIASAAQLYDPQTNAYAAYAMYLRAGGWGPWSS